ncbi:hypothetical protein [Fructobacillus papyrifericola]|uniref:Uncharacterized protein n=1 Tax=Fructobacillus papyrifericola TaxID=2713172 RepID=A0ABS5QU96_9LACO|nr:hypothetical protein [Fructobacillus papyrifericola]MBS9336517.1 hypothetical protein [Fructobacillus papyrifericola]
MVFIGFTAIFIILFWITWKLWTEWIPWLIILYIAALVISFIADVFGVLFSVPGLVIIAIGLGVGIPLGLYVQKKQNEKKQSNNS